MAGQTFSYTGGWQKFTVPKDVRQVTFEVYGAGSNPGGDGGLVTGAINVSEDDVLWIQVGQGGQAGASQGGAGGWPNGGNGGDGKGGTGGNGGGGSSLIRKGTKTGTVLALAGGAGGTAGSGSFTGGNGGAADGQDGVGTAHGTDETTAGRGGSQRVGGAGGTTTVGSTYKGKPGGGRVGQGGEGGGPNEALVIGGGGGGGGYFPGGGGAAGKSGVLAAGGGGGGSNYLASSIVAGRTGRGTGANSNGSVVLTWVPAKAKNQKPTPPTKVRVNGVLETAGMSTMATNQVTITAMIDDPNAGQKVKMVLVPETADPKQANLWRNLNVLGTSYQEQKVKEIKKKNPNQHVGDTHMLPVLATIIVRGLRTNTLYKARLYTKDERGTFSGSFQSVSFWTDRTPSTTATAPDENSSLIQGSVVRFEWTYSDPDGSATQRAAEIRWRHAATPSDKAGAWVTRRQNNAKKYLDITGASFRGGLSYDWQVRVQDTAGLWSSWTVTRSFYIIAATIPPALLYPINNRAVQVGALASPFTWTFRHFSSGVYQTGADLQYRVVGAASWVTLFGDSVVPGGDPAWPADEIDLQPGYHYEWQVRTIASNAEVSDWSTSGFFWAIPAPGSLLPVEPASGGGPKNPLGEGNNRAFVYDRGGKVLRGELTNLTSIQWARQRDDISEATVTMENFDDLLLQLLRETHTWMHELVIFRESFGVQERVWEGPITLIQDENDRVTIKARDCMQYLARRVMRQGYNDAYQVIHGVQVGLRTVVERATLNIINALAYDDPNLIGYLTPIENDADAKQSSIVPDYSKMVQEDIDEMAANRGLDYTTVGRRIVLWDTHRMIGRLPEMRSSDFLSPPTVSEYGMDLAVFYAVTDGSGVWGSASRGLNSAGDPKLYGWVEMLASSYGLDANETVDSSTLTAAARDALSQTYSEQAQRNIAPRWPAPVLVKVPDNTRLSPEVNVGINQLIPGVWVPVRVNSRIRDVSQWQKLDNVTVNQGPGGEQITVVMSPAPNGGQDPDVEATAGEDDA
jgi:hypothetical protein